MIDIEQRAKSSRLKLLNSEYGDEIANLLAVMKADLWLIGGWVRSHLLGCEDSYVGDIDLLVEMQNSELHARIIAAGISCQPNAWCGVRILLHDGNYIDIGSVANFGGQDISEAMRNADFSINAVSVNLRSAKVECGLSQEEMRWSGFAARKRVNRRDFGVETCKTSLIYQNYYGLSPSNDAITSSLLVETQQRHINREFTEQSLNELLEIVSGREAWIVRGFARCKALGQLEFWDDIDVVVIDTAVNLIKTISDLGYRYSLTIFGNPKLLLSDERTADIWCLQDEELASHLSTYSHTVDSTAISLSSGQLYGNNIGNEEQSIDIGPVFMMHASPHDLDYAALKLAYLAIRHGYKLEHCAEKLLTREITDSIPMRKNSLRLATELSIIDRERIKENSSRFFQQYGHNAAARYFAQRLKKSTARCIGRKTKGTGVDLFYEGCWRV